MDIYLLVGGSNTRKSSTVRALTGSKAARYDSKDAVWMLEFSTGVRSALIVTSALQESQTSIEEIVDAIRRLPIEAAVLPLRVKAMQRRGSKLPPGLDYIAAFKAAKWRVHIAEMEAQVCPSGSTPNVHLHAAASRPANVSAAKLRKAWHVS